MSPLKVQLTGRASRYLKIMVDYGHLDAAGVDHVLFHVSDMVGTEGGTVADFDLVREVTASALFGDAGEVFDEGGVLAEDWPFLFS